MIYQSPAIRFSCLFGLAPAPNNALTQTQSLHSKNIKLATTSSPCSKHGFIVTSLALGLATSFESTYGFGGRLVVFNAEYDTQPSFGHTRGHNLGTSSAAFLAVAPTYGTTLSLAACDSSACPPKKAAAAAAAAAESSCSPLVPSKISTHTKKISTRASRQAR